MNNSKEANDSIDRMLDTSIPRPALRKTRKMLWRMCRCVFQYPIERSILEDSKRRFPFYSNASFMKSAARDGCLLCAQFLQIIEWADMSQDVGLGQYLDLWAFSSQPDAPICSLGLSCCLDKGSTHLLLYLCWRAVCRLKVQYLSFTKDIMKTLYL